MPLGTIRRFAVSSCGECACRFLDIIPTPTSVEAIYGLTYFTSENELAQGYAADRGDIDELTAARRFSAVLDQVGNGGRPLEIGCGDREFWTSRIKTLRLSGDRYLERCGRRGAGQRTER